MKNKARVIFFASHVIKRLYPLYLALTRTIPPDPRAKLNQFLKRLVHAALTLLDFRRVSRNKANSQSRTDFAVYRHWNTPENWKTAELVNKIYALYLPQFHTIAENDEWWGKGFTEWTNVFPSKSQFSGHYQPHVPIGSGYYDLSDPRVIASQSKLAKNYGIDGFGFYFYWFRGKTLLEAPIQTFASDPSIDFEFHLCWANENWTRTWDGLNNEVLLAQEHSDEDDLAFIKYVAKYFKDPRYSTVDGRKLLAIYRPDLLPDANKTFGIWRRYCIDSGIGELHIIACQSKVLSKQERNALDVEGFLDFTPNGVPLLEVNLREQKNFKGRIFDIRDVQNSRPNLATGDKTVFPSVTLSWDNTPRRKSKSTVFINAEPKQFRADLETAKDIVKNNPLAEKIIYINAWNEWAEGAHLEPDQKYGYSWLQSIYDFRQSQRDAPRITKEPIAFVFHDLYKHGAQLLGASLVNTFSRSFNAKVHAVVLGLGPLEREIDPEVDLHTLLDATDFQIREKFEELYCAGVRSVLINTLVSAKVVEAAKKAGLGTVVLVHELGNLIKEYNLEGVAKKTALYADRIIFASTYVQEDFKTFAEVEDQKLGILPQGIYQRLNEISSATGKRSFEPYSVVGVGYADKRKGFDIFLEHAELASALELPLRFTWVGNLSDYASTLIASKSHILSENGGNLELKEFNSDISAELVKHHLYLLSSREDPFPSVVLEGLANGLQVACIEACTGIEETVREYAGLVLSQVDFRENLDKIVLACRPEKQKTYEQVAEIRNRFNFTGYASALLKELNFERLSVSVIVTNFNHENYIAERINSILKQTYSVDEIIFLDDCSSDGSLEIAKQLLGNCGVKYQIIENSVNSGNVFSQWRSGISQASSDLIWVAESDDTCDPRFLETMVAKFKTPGLAFAYSESNQIDENSRIISTNYDHYSATFQLERRQFGFTVPGNLFSETCLQIKNTVPNVSAVIFSRETLQDVFSRHADEIVKLKWGGDWLVYFLLSLKGLVAYEPTSLNFHRRHSKSVIGSANWLEHVDEVEFIQTRVRSSSEDSDIRSQAREYIEELKSRVRLAEAQ